MNHETPAVALAEQYFRIGDSPRAVATLLAHRSERDCLLRLREWACASKRDDVLRQLSAHTLSPDDPEQKVGAAIQLLASGRALDALQSLDQICATDPQLPSAHHHAAKALQNLGQSERALQRLSLSLQLRPDYPEAWFSRAHVLRAVGRLADAVESYRKALQLVPDFTPALINLGITLAAMDQPQQALALFEQVLDRSPDDVEASLNKGLCLHALGHWQQALETYTLILDRHPEHGPAHFFLGCLYNEQKLPEAARRHLQAALNISPDDVDAHVELIGLFEQTNDLAQADHQLEQALRLAPHHPGLHLEAMRLARRQGDLNRAEAHLAAIDPASLSPRQAQTFWFECGLLKDRANDPESAMTAFIRGNALAARSPRRQGIDRRAFGERNARIRHWLDQAAPGAHPQSMDPVVRLPFRNAFLVGFPRSGTTLLDTMLDAHSQVVSIEERPTLELAISEVFGSNDAYPECMSQLDSGALTELRSRYLTQASRWIPEGFGGLLLDKLPLRMLRVPMLHRLFPEAPILFAVRHPCDVVLSNFMQQYDPNEAFIHFDTLQDAAALYDQVMSTWRIILESLPIAPHRVRYESLIADPESVLSTTCLALGLEMQAGMLDAQTRLADRQPLRTNSYQQVAEPVYTRAVARWRRYEAWLKPVLPILMPHIRWLGYDEP